MKNKNGIRRLDAKSNKSESVVLDRASAIVHNPSAADLVSMFHSGPARDTYTAVLHRNKRHSGMPMEQYVITGCTTSSGELFRDGHCWLKTAEIESVIPREGWEAHITFTADQYEYLARGQHKSTSLKELDILSVAYKKKKK